MEKTKIAKAWWFVGFMIIMLAGSCASLKNTFNPPTLTVEPAETVMTPALIKKPITFTCTGFQPGEMVSVEMILPPGIKMKGIEDGEHVGIAYGNADNNGNSKTAMKPTATLDWFFQVGWTSNLKPDFKVAKPLPPGTYDIIATGLVSGWIGKSTLKVLPPPKKK